MRGRKPPRREGAVTDENIQAGRADVVPIFRRAARGRPNAAIAAGVGLEQVCNVTPLAAFPAVGPTRPAVGPARPAVGPARPLLRRGEYVKKCLSAEVWSNNALVRIGGSPARHLYAYANLVPNCLPYEMRNIYSQGTRTISRPYRTNALFVTIFTALSDYLVQVPH